MRAKAIRGVNLHNLGLGIGSLDVALKPEAMKEK